MVNFPESAGFGITFERGAWYVAILFRGISLGILVGCICFNLFYAFFLMDLSGHFWESLRGLTLYLLIMLLCIGFVYINTYLWQGITKPDRTGIFPWLIVTSVLNIIFLGIFLYSFTAGFSIVQIFVFLIIGFTFYCIFVVLSFYKELGRSPPSSNPTQQTPT